jgi:nucleoside-diphosphate-sugar epimerase
LLLAPLYALARRVPAWRDGARRLGLVTLEQMVASIVRAVENPPPAGSRRIVDASAIAGL